MAKQLEELCEEMERMLQGRADTTKLHLAVEEGVNPAVAYIIKRDRFEVRKADGDGNTPLHIACIVSNRPAAKGCVIVCVH